MNRLGSETSPYLRQHADNPVDWYPWGDAAFEKAKREDKPILVSIGYSTCHWCHVMERESFENEDIAALMNEYFVNIKVDREERPDVDAVYMEAVQIMTGSGGWPLNCFLLPDGRPFYGGTYFPPHAMQHRPSWGQVLQNLHRAYATRKSEVVEQAQKLTEFVRKADDKLLGNAFGGLSSVGIFDESLLENIFYGIRARFDRLEGGIGSAPKFPSTMSLKYCLDYYFFTKNEEALEQVVLSLDKMIQGGIYDQIGGGFSRYATDRAWLIPHFEKMLYDNALLVSLLVDVYKLTKKPLYKETIVETLAFVRREMWSLEGGFYAAQDADSEGVEGKYYVWEWSEVEAILGDDAILFGQFYDVTEVGNWEGVNILWRKEAFEIFAKAKGLGLEDFKSKMANCREQLFAVRDKRIKPSLDDKILLGWNALMATAFVKAYTALGDVAYLEIAQKNIDFLMEKFETPTFFYHTYKDDQPQHHAFLDDYAFLIEALLALFEVTQDREMLEKAGTLAVFVLDNFYDTDTKLFYFTETAQTDLIVRKKDLYDNAMPSGNSTMVHNLQQLGILLGVDSYKAIATEMLQQVQSSIEKFPSSFAKWANALLFEVHGYQEIAIVGKSAFTFSKELSNEYQPNRVIMASEFGDEDFPLLHGKLATAETLFYVCQNYACQLPVQSVGEVLVLGNRK